MQKDNLNLHVFQDRNWCSTKSVDDFFLTLAVRDQDPSIGKI